MTFYNMLSMGGYAIFVWPAFTITFVVFGINIALSLYEKKNIKKIIRLYYES